jgi:EAL and modified HD-GYP domain-containing signal transduction protein
LFSFIKRVFGGRQAAHLNGDPFARDTPPPPAATEAPASPPRAALPVVLQRDEIIDGKTRIAGYRFSARRPDSPLHPDAHATVEVLAGNNVAALAERRIALIPVTARDWLGLDYKPLIGPNTLFLLDLPGNESEIAGWHEVAAMIHAAGARIALPGSSIVAHRALIGGVADFLVVDFSTYSLASFEQAINALRAERPDLQLIAEHVKRWPEHRYCMAHGVSLCIGPFTTEQDEEQQSGEIGQSRLVLIDMLNQLRQEADLADIAEIAKRDPGVVIKVVAMANSPMLVLERTVTSIDQAIMVLGREQLYRWLAIGMFRAGASSPRDEVLLELALARGRFLECLGQGRHSRMESDELFLLGLLSLLDCLLGLSMATVLERIHLSPTLKDVLLNSSGPLGRYLLLAIAVEKGHVENVARLADQLGYPLDAIESASVEAIGWAEQAVQLSS